MNKTVFMIVLQEYTGFRCETQVSCMEHICENNGRCVKETSYGSRCHCPLGWGGNFCEEGLWLLYDTEISQFICTFVSRAALKDENV